MMTGNDTATPSFTPTEAGSYVFHLSIDDGFGGTSTDIVTVTVINRAPTAVATATGPPIVRGQIVVLDGTASVDDDGDPLTYAWRQVGGPNVTLTDADTATAAFVATELGTYGFNLTVDDGFGGSDETSVTVTVLNRNPIADAGPDQPGAAKNIVLTLDASGSSDPDGDALGYAWTSPPGVILSDANSPTPTFTATRSGTYTFLLQVDDGLGGVAMDAVVVTVLNAPPVAVANAPATAAKYAPVSLDGTASSDPDGDALTYVWTRVSGPFVTINGQDGALAAFTPAVSGTYVFQLTVDDGDLGGTDATQVTVSVPNAAPVADAGLDILARKGYWIALAGSAFDPDGDAVALIWSPVSGPASVTLNDATTTRPNFVAQAVGIYVFRLEATDTEGAVGSDQIAVTVWGLAPMAIVTANPTVAEVGASISFDGRGSSDPDGTIVDFVFDFDDGTPPVGGPSSAKMHAYSTPGSYSVSLVVTDDDGNVSAPVTVTIIVEPASSPSWATTMLIVAFLALVPVFLLLAVAAARRRKKPAEEVEGQPEEKAEGEEIRAEPGEEAADVSEPREDGGMNQ